MTDRRATNGTTATHMVGRDSKGSPSHAGPVAIPEPASVGLPGTLTETGYCLPADLSYERWVEIGQTLQQMERSIQFWLGDWWDWGERR